MNRKPNFWHTIQLTIVSAVCMSPFFFLAKDLSDGDELLKGAVAASMVGVSGVILKKVGGNDSKE